MEGIGSRCGVAAATPQVSTAAACRKGYAGAAARAGNAGENRRTYARHGGYTAGRARYIGISITIALGQYGYSGLV